ncbi:MAG: M56 family metallopeptidase, partial [Verrucomicrobiota bacterium]
MKTEFATLVDALGWSLLHSLWQGAVVGLLLWTLLWLLPKRSARLRYAASGFALLLLLGAFSVTVVHHLPSLEPPAAAETPAPFVAELPKVEAASSQNLENIVEGERPSSLAPASPTVSRPVPELPVSFTDRLRPALPWCVGSWAAGVLFFLVRFLVGLHVVRRWKKTGAPVTGTAWQTRISRLCSSLQISRPVRVLTSAAVAVPVVVGWMKPVVLLPVGLLSGLSTQQLEALIAHELAHIRRHDYFVNLLQKLVDTCFFYHPVVWWISAQIRKERENCCDDLAVSASGGVLGYASALTALEELRNTAPSYGVAATGSPLIQRIRRILGATEKRNAAWPVGVVLMIGLAAAVFSIAFAKQATAQDDSPATETSHITNGNFSSYCVHDGKDTHFVLITPKSFTIDPDTNLEGGSITWDVNTSSKTHTIYFSQKEDAPGLVGLRNGGMQWSHWDLERGNVFWCRYDRHEFSPAIYQVPITAKAVTTPEVLTATVAKATAWLAAADGEARWEQTRVNADGEYKPGQPLSDDFDILWGEPNEIGLRLGLGGVKEGQACPLGRALPLKQYLRNDGSETVRFSTTGYFGEGLEGFLEDKQGNKFSHKKGYPWPITLSRHVLEPGHFKEFTTGGLLPLPANKDGSSAAGFPRTGSAMVVQPGDYTLHISQIIGEYIGNPQNANLADPGIAPGLGEWTGRLHAAPLPIRITDPKIGTAKPGETRTFDKIYRVEFRDEELRLAVSNPRKTESFHNDGGAWKIKNPENGYLAAWDVGGSRLWLVDGPEVQKLSFSQTWKDAGRWPIEQADGNFGNMPKGVRQALRIPAFEAAVENPNTSVMGRSLDNVSSTTDRSTLTEIYEPDGETLKADVFEMPLVGAAGNPQLLAPKNGDVYYIAQAEKVYGPIESDPAQDLNLSALMRKKLAEEPNREGLAVLERMIRKGNGPLLNLSFRLLGELEEPQVPFDFDGIFDAMIGSSIEDRQGPKHLGMEAQLGSSQFFQVFHRHRVEWEERRVQLPEDRYQKDSDMSAENASIMWTDPHVDGLSIGVSGLQSDLQIGGSIPLEVYIRNDSEETVKFSWTQDPNPQMRVWLTDSNGESHSSAFRFAGGLDDYKHASLEPGFGIKVVSVDLENFAKPEEIETAGHEEGKSDNPRLAIPKGSYSLEVEYRIGLDKFKDFPKTPKNGEKLAMQCGV